MALLRVASLALVLSLAPACAPTRGRLPSDPALVSREFGTFRILMRREFAERDERGEDYVATQYVRATDDSVHRFARIYMGNWPPRTCATPVRDTTVYWYPARVCAGAESDTTAEVWITLEAHGSVGNAVQVQFWPRTAAEARWARASLASLRPMGVD